MKPKFLLIFLFSLLTYNLSLFSQTTIVLRPHAESGKDAFIHKRIPDSNHGDHFDFAAMAWTNYGVPNVVKSLIDFDLSSIPEGSRIISAGLSLYAQTSPLNGSHSTLSGSNEAVLLRITEPWIEDSVTWDNQPAASDLLSVKVPESISDTQHYLNMDVTYAIQDKIDNPSNNYGFLIQLLSEEYWRCLIFASSDHEDPHLHPKLEITYAEPNEFGGIMTIRPGDSTGKDAFIHSRLFYNNYGDHPDFSSMAWTNDGIPCDVRNLLWFDLWVIPEHNEINYAGLSFYSHHSPSNGSHSSLSGSNESILKCVVSEWDENNVTWETQPPAIDDNEVILAESQSTFENYLNIDVTGMVRDMIDYENNVIHGFLLKLVTEEYYRSMIFASSDHADTTLHPKLVVCYSLETSVNPINNEPQLSVYPNPAYENVKIEVVNNQDATLRIFDARGRLVYQKVDINKLESVNVSNLGSGIFTIQIISKENILIKKLVVN